MPAGAGGPRRAGTGAAAVPVGSGGRNRSRVATSGGGRRPPRWEGNRSRAATPSASCWPPAAARSREVWLADGVDPAPILDEIAALAAGSGVPVLRVARARLAAAATTEAPQGVLALAAPLPEATLEELAAPSPGGGPPFLLVLDGVTDPHNLGALLRSAACAGATGAVLPRHRSAHVTATVAKAAAGAIEHLRFALVAGVPAALSTLKAAGVWTVGLDADAPASLWTLAVATEPVALVLGAEGAGLAQLTRRRCDLLVAVPQTGAIASLNVAAAGALACFEVARHRAGQLPTVAGPPVRGAEVRRRPPRR